MIDATETELRRAKVVTTDDIVGIVGGTRMVTSGLNQLYPSASNPSRKRVKPGSKTEEQSKTKGT